MGWFGVGGFFSLFAPRQGDIFAAGDPPVPDHPGGVGRGGCARARQRCRASERIHRQEEEGRGVGGGGGREQLNFKHKQPHGARTHRRRAAPLLGPRAGAAAAPPPRALRRARRAGG